MRVAYVCADLGIPVWGNKGCSIHVQEILRALLRDNIEVDLVAMLSGGECPAGLEAVALHLIEEDLPREPSAREQSRIQLNKRVSEVLAALGPFDAVYERYSLWSYAGVEFARHEGIPGLLEVNAPLVEEQAKHRVLVDREAAVAATERAFYAASAILPVSEEVAKYVRGYGVSGERIHVIPNAVHAKDFSVRHDGFETASNTFTIGFVGTLKTWHGVDRLIAAYEQLWNGGEVWRLVIAGDGPDRQRLESLVREMPSRIASSIEFLGAVPHASIPRILESFDVAVAPGVSGEAYFSPMKIFEYMAAGLPIVAARLGQIATLVDEGVTGLLYNPDDTRELAVAIRSLRSDPRLAARLGEAARREVLAHHTWDQRRDSILKIVRSSAGVYAPSGS